MGSVFEISNSYNVHRVRKAQWYAANVTRDANNQREASITALQEFSRSLGNQKALEAAGKEYNAAVGNLAEALDSRTLGSANMAMKAAEVQGALASQAGFLGIGGSSVKLLEDTTKIQSEMEKSLYDEQTTRFSYRSSQQNVGILDKAVGSLDNSQYFANIDHTIYVKPKPLKNRIGAIIGVAVATYFGGPQAGQAAADTTMASWNAANGNFGAASQYYGAAAQGAFAGFQNWQNAKAAGHNSWFAAVTAGNEQKQKVNDGDGGADGQSLSWFNKNSSNGYGGGSNWGWGFSLGSSSSSSSYGSVGTGPD